MQDAKKGATPKTGSAGKRRERAAAELRSNLAKRKALARARARHDDPTDEIAPAAASEPASGEDSGR